METFACEPRLFILSSLFYVETFKLQECWYESQNRPGIPWEPSRLPRRRRSYSATVCCLREEATKCRKVALISAERWQQTRQSSVQANERSCVRAQTSVLITVGIPPTLAERCCGTLAGQTPALTSLRTLRVQLRLLAQHLAGVRVTSSCSQNVCSHGGLSAEARPKANGL